MKHNYPKERAPRNTDYAVSTQLINKLGLSTIEEIWKEHGMYVGAEELTKLFGAYVSPYIVRYLSHRHNWVRIITDRTLPIYVGVKRGSVPADFYKHIIFN